MVAGLAPLLPFAPFASPPPLPFIAPPALLLWISSSSVRRSQVIFPFFLRLLSSPLLLRVLQLGRWRGGGSVFEAGGEALQMAQVVI